MIPDDTTTSLNNAHIVMVLILVKKKDCSDEPCFPPSLSTFQDSAHRLGYPPCRQLVEYTGWEDNCRYAEEKSRITEHIQRIAKDNGFTYFNAYVCVELASSRARFVTQKSSL